MKINDPATKHNNP